MSDAAIPVRRALVSCFDKTGVTDLAAALHERGVTLVSTGSTAATIREVDVPVTEVAEVTGFPECLDGRVKTLHPRIHAGILADRTDPAHIAELAELGVEAIDLVVVNLYPFERTVQAGAGDDDVIEMIDIGGPTMIRAAAKNHGSVVVVVDPSDYEWVLTEIDDQGGVTLATRRELAAKAFRHTAAYDTLVASWFQRDEAFPSQLGLALPRASSLRYGENPHQGAAYYARPGAGGLADAEQLHGKALSYNNLLDTDAAWGMAVDVDEPCVAIIKHTNPAGFAVADDLEQAYVRALEGDPVSAFGGIVAANRPIDGATARRIGEVFTEVVIAPGFDDEALEVLTAKKNLRILCTPDASRPRGGQQLRSVAGGILVQDADVGDEPWGEWRVAGQVQPSEATLADLRFAWLACKHTKSNAIVLAKAGQVVGVGAGQMSRVDSVRLAVERSGDRHVGAVLASDAFFPFRDGPDAAAAAGVIAMVQPGGSVRDDEVVAAADEHGIAMVLTGRRHFRH
ncbi:bifunctional phosphoribosylaminoimidazolecarboxamide formyltransferase/IMP cyclohydrolase [Nitriliruptor alkaliphilus]|uniref:bifunctional phosphoribosylaminoimidazolecarboxamide formyltransferase/IMP cyclohydrolase n=1 Tax=Nitriliruptor alkaliphilus TaxID=427918 RepID=UPI000697BF88|nr:bifunctional phosphoribosylaminoimidazolecarboxamide formyltransferase/IMP cyclohydrolase [Nitriliruptor alkaliphilus]